MILLLISTRLFPPIFSPIFYQFFTDYLVNFSINFFINFSPIFPPICSPIGWLQNSHCLLLSLYLWCFVSRSRVTEFQASALCAKKRNVDFCLAPRRTSELFTTLAWGAFKALQWSNNTTVQRGNFSPIPAPIYINPPILSQMQGVPHGDEKTIISTGKSHFD